MAYLKGDGSGEVLSMYSTDGVTWSTPTTILMKSKVTPVLLVRNDTLYCYALELGGVILCTANTSDGKKWWSGGETSSILGVATESSLSLATLELSGSETLFCAYKNSEGGLTVETMNEEQWMSSLNGKSTLTTPSLSVLNGQLVCTFIENQAPYGIKTYTSPDGKNWTLHDNVFGGGQSIATTTMIWNCTETLICAYHPGGVENDIFTMATTDGVHWHNLFPQAISGLKALCAPGIVDMGGKLFMALQGAGGDKMLDVFDVEQEGNILHPDQNMGGYFNQQYLRRDYVDFRIDDNLDLHGIYKNSTASGLPEVVTLSKASNYWDCTSQKKVALPYGPGNWTFFLGANLDLFGVLKSGSGSGNMEVHVLTAASGYQEFASHAATPMPYPAEGDQFLLAPNHDLFCIDSNQKVKVLTASSGYTKFTAIPVYTLNGDEDFGNAPIQYHMDGDRNIYALQLSGPNQYQVKLYGFSAAENYATMKIGNVQFPAMTSLQSVGLAHQLIFDKNMDLHILDTDPIGSPFVMHRTLTATSGYQTGAAQIKTQFSKTIYPEFKLGKGEIAFFRGINYSGGTWKLSNVADYEQGGNAMGKFVPINEISSVKVGPETGITIASNGQKKPEEDHFANADHLNGVQYFQMMTVEEAADAGVGYSVLLTEDYRYNASEELESFKAYQTILKFAPGTTSVTIFLEGDSVFYYGKNSYGSDSVDGRTLQIPEGSDSMVISVEATAIGTSALKVCTSSMKPKTYVPVFPAQQVHHKIANLPADAIYHNQKNLGMKTALTQDQCGGVQQAIQNMAKAAKFPGPATSPYANPGEMDHPHWQVAFGEGTATYNPLTAAESQAILNNSQEIQAGGAHGFLSFVSNAFNSAKSFAVSTVKAAATDVADAATDVANAATSVVHAAEHVVSDAAQAADNTVKDAENAANAALNTLGVAHLVHDVAGGLEDAAGDALDAAESVGQDAVAVVKVTVQFADHAVTIVADHTGVVGHLIGSILNKVGAEIDDVVNFLSAAFDWTEIVRIKNAINSGVNSAFPYANQHSSGVQSQGDQLLDSMKSDVKSVISKLQPLSSTTIPSHESIISPEMAHKILWFLSKYQEYTEGFPYPKFNLFGESPSSQTSTKLEAMEQKLLAMGVKDVSQVLAKLGATLSESAQDSTKTMDELIEGVLSIAEDIVDDGVDAIKLIFDTMMELYEEQLANMPSFLNQSFPVPFFQDLTKLLNISDLTYADVIGFAVAIPAEVYEKEKGITLLANPATLSGDAVEAMTIFNSISSAIGGAVAAIQAMKAKPAQKGQTPEVKSFDVVNLGLALFNQYFRSPTWYIATSDNQFGPAMFMWSYQWAMIFFNAYTLKVVYDKKKDLRLFNAAGQIARFILTMIVLYPPTATKRLEAFCVPLPGIIAPLPKLTGASPDVKVGTAVAQGIIASTYEALIWVNE